MHIELNFPELQSADWKIETFHQNGFKYQRLIDKKGIIKMLNTPDIVKDFETFLNIAEGSILINGLGMGMCNVHLLKKESVRDLTVIEFDKSLVDFISPFFADEPRCTIIHGDALSWEPPKGKRYDYVWHDIWTNPSARNVAQIDFLKEKYTNIAGWQGAWREAVVRQKLKDRLALKEERGY